MQSTCTHAHTPTHREKGRREKERERKGVGGDKRGRGRILHHTTVCGTRNRKQEVDTKERWKHTSPPTPTRTMWCLSLSVALPLSDTHTLFPSSLTLSPSPSLPLFTCLSLPPPFSLRTPHPVPLQQQVHVSNPELGRVNNWTLKNTLTGF